MKTPNGNVKSEEGKLYKFKPLNYDIVHTVGPSEPIEAVLPKFFPEITYTKIDPEIKLEDYVGKYKKILA